MQRRRSLFIGIGIVALLIASFSGARPLRAQEAHGPAEAKSQATASEPVAAHPSDEGDPAKAEPGLAIWTLVVFVGLLIVLGRYAWKPLIHALHEREKHLEHVLLETERARNESESLLSEHRKQMAHAADEVRGILDKARQDAQAAGEQIIKLAQGEAEAARQRAQRDIASARDQALAEIWQTTADMAVSVAGRVLSKELTEGEHRRLLDVAIRELPEASTSNGQGGRAG
jgi:F-type H+-transporting ATPase subunit b